MTLPVKAEMIDASRHVGEGNGTRQDHGFGGMRACASLPDRRPGESQNHQGRHARSLNLHRYFPSGVLSRRSPGENQKRLIL